VAAEAELTERQEVVMAQQRPDADMKLPGVPYRVGLILGILIVTLGCASPPPVPENRAMATGPSQAQS
jgi:hypothetical protein